MAYADMTYRQWQTYIKERLTGSDKYLTNAIVSIYTAQERQTATGFKSPIEGVGFSRVDNQVLSEYAQKILAGVSLSNKELAIARTKMYKYWRQIMRIEKGV